MTKASKQLLPAALLLLAVVAACNAEGLGSTRDLKDQDSGIANGKQVGTGGGGSDWPGGGGDWGWPRHIPNPFPHPPVPTPIPIDPPIHLPRPPPEHVSVDPPIHHGPPPQVHLPAPVDRPGHTNPDATTNAGRKLMGTAGSTDQPSAGTAVKPPAGQPPGPDYFPNGGPSQGGWEHIPIDPPIHHPGFWPVDPPFPFHRPPGPRPIPIPIDPPPHHGRKLSGSTDAAATDNSGSDAGSSQPSGGTVVKPPEGQPPGPDYFPGGGPQPGPGCHDLGKCGTVHPIPAPGKGDWPGSGWIRPPVHYPIRHPPIGIVPVHPIEPPSHPVPVDDKPKDDPHTPVKKVVGRKLLAQA